MVTKVFSLAGIAALGGLVWMGCSSDDNENKAGPSGDAGTDSSPAETEDAGGGPNDQDTGTKQQPGVEVKFGQCAAFTKCDSDPVGSWTVTGGCLSEDAFAPAKAQCPALQERDVKITAEGTVDVTATTVTRKTTIYLSGKVLIPKTCSPFPSCDAISAGLQAGIGGLQFDQATCTEDGANCDCVVSSELKPLDSTDPYTADNGTLTVNGTKTQTYDYCVDGSTINYQETTQGNPLSFVIEMTK